MSTNHQFIRFITKHCSTALVFFLTFLIYFATNPALPQRFDHQIYLADSLLKGRVDLVYYPIEYHDVFNINGKKYTAFGLGPVLLILPLVAIFDYSLNLTLTAMIIGSINSALFWKLTEKFTKSTALKLFAIVGFSFGTIHWFSSTVGTSWYFSMVTAVFFVLLTLIFILNQKPFPAGILFGLAVLSRFPLALAFPGIIMIINKGFASRWLSKLANLRVRLLPSEATPSEARSLPRVPPKAGRVGDGERANFANEIVFILGALPAALLFFTYNYLRFGNILETGYQFANWQYMTELNSQSFGLQYLPKNLFTFIFRGLDYIEKFPYAQVTFGGVALLFSSPWLLLSLASDIKNRLNQALIIIIAPILSASLLYFTPGIGVQPSWRFVMDFLPFAAILSLAGMEKVPKQLSLIAVSTGVIFTVLGLYWAKISGW